jgi:CRP-like cAMP-binding protein
MPDGKPAPKPAQNRLLAALPREDHSRLVERLEPIPLEFKQPLHEPGVPIEHVYFPTSGIVSLVVDVEGDGPIEVATIGNEGLVGVPVFLGADTMPGRSLCQIPGDALRTEARAFKEEADRPGPFRDLLLRYTQALFNLVAQTAACTRAHSVEERCARWLLITQDRIGSDRFPLTQEFMGQMLGVRRATVNVAAGMLQKAGFITYTRGRITVLDRAGLETAACECYHILRQEFDRLLGAR